MADQLQITGKYLGAKATEIVGNKGYTVRKFYVDITTNPDWPNTPEFKLKGDKVNLVDNLKKGDTVTVKFNLNGRKWEKDGRSGVIVDLEAWKIEVLKSTSAAALGGAQVPPVAQARPVATAAPAVPAVALPGEFQHAGQDDDVLPF